MSRVIGIGETVFDIIFDSTNTPVSGKPGGSVYNALISLGRRGVGAAFISEVGDDKIGQIIRQFLTDNGVDATSVCSFSGGKSPLALAFLDANKNAQYQFYKDYPAQRLSFQMPRIEADDVVLIGSYFALNPVLRPQVKAFLEHARAAGALIYYDVNFRANHRHEAAELMPTIIENFQLADIVKGSDEDFENMFGTANWREAYAQHIAPHCNAFICTRGAAGATMLIDGHELTAPGIAIEPVSTVGAGDNFNAGTVYGFIRHGITRANLHTPEALPRLQLSMQSGIEFATEVCQSLDNYVARRG